jgi:hypothetical protein
MRSLMELAAKNTLDLKLEESAGYQDHSSVARYRLVSSSPIRSRFAAPAYSLDLSFLAQERYHLARIEAARCALASLSRRKACNCFRDDYRPRDAIDSYEAIRDESLLASLRQLTPSAVPHAMLREEIDSRNGRWRGCLGCKKRFQLDVTEVKDSWTRIKINLVSTATPFKLKQR